MTGAAIAQATRSFFTPYLAAEIAAQPCYVCAMPAAAQIGTCALDNRWVPLCEPCHRAWYKLSRAYVGELGGTRHVAPSKAHDVVGARHHAVLTVRCKPEPQVARVPRRAGPQQAH